MGCSGTLEGGSEPWLKGEGSWAGGPCPGTGPLITGRIPPGGGLRPGSVGRCCYLDLMGRW